MSQVRGGSSTSFLWRQIAAIELSVACTPSRTSALATTAQAEMSFVAGFIVGDMPFWLTHATISVMYESRSK